MSLDLSSVSLPFDRWGNAPSNKRENERHTLTNVNWTEYNIIIPKYAPFYSESIDHLIHLPSGRILERGKDWCEGWYFQSASGEIGLDIHCCIYFYDPHLTGEVEIPSYQAMGGEWQLNGQLLTQILAKALLNPLRYYWEQVAELPSIFNPLDHDQDIQDFTKLGDLIDVLREIAIAVGGDDGKLEQHMLDFDNPHKVDKFKIDLGNLNNWPIAQAADIIAGSLNAQRYMNPTMTYQMITQVAIAALNMHSNRVDNPHNTRADQTGAYFKAEVDALLESLAAGLIHNVNAFRLEGKSVQDIVDMARTDGNTSLDQLRRDLADLNTAILAHAQRVDNPHNTRANQTGAYFTTEVDQIIESLASGMLHDIYAYRLEGKSVNEIVNLAVTNVTNQIEQIKSEFQQTIQNTLEGFQAEDTIRFAGKSEVQWQEVIRQIAAGEGNSMTFRSIAALAAAQTAESPYAVTTTGVSVTYLGDIDRFDRDGSNVGIGEHKALSSLKLVIGHPTNLNQVGAVVEVTFDRSGSTGNYWYTGTLPADFQLFTDDNTTIAGRRRLFLRSGADRTALEMMITSMTGFWPANNDEGVYMEGAPDAWGHSNRYNLSGNAFATAASVTSVNNSLALTNQAVTSLNTLTGDHSGRIDKLEKSNKVRFAANRTIAASNKLTLDLQTYIQDPADIALYDYRGARINVLVLDEEAGSPSNGSYINSEALVTKAIRSDRYLDLHNHTGNALTVAIRIEIPLL